MTPRVKYELQTELGVISGEDKESLLREAKMAGGYWELYEVIPSSMNEIRVSSRRILTIGQHREVFRLHHNGLPSHRIGRQFSLCAGTVEKILSNSCDK